MLFPIYKSVYFGFPTKFVGFQTAWNSWEGSRCFRVTAWGEVLGLKMELQVWWAQPLLHLLLVEGAAPVGERAVLAQGVGELRVEPVGQAGRDPLPDQDENDDDGRLTRVSCSLAHQAQQLLLLTASADYLRVQQHTPQSPNTKDAILNVKSKREGNLSITVHLRSLLLLVSSSLLLAVQSVFLTVIWQAYTLLNTPRV